MPSSHVSSASYPIAQPLATILKAAIPNADKDTNGAAATRKDNIKLVVDRESQEDALQHFIRNCFVAMDNVFFST